MTPPNSGNFTVGQKVVCVDDSPGELGLPGPLVVRNSVYVVRAAGVYESFGPWVRLVGMVYPAPKGFEEPVWRSSRFRSLDELKAESKLKSVVKQFLKEKANL